MSQYATKMEYDRAKAKRDLDPHAPAVCAMWLWGKRYSQQNLGSMGFWDSLSESEQNLCRDMAEKIKKARDE